MKQKKKKIKSKNSKMNKNKTILFIIDILFLLSFIISSINVFNAYDLYKTGEHNSDLGQNMRYLSSRFGVEIYDTASDFKTYSDDEVYINGENQQRTAVKHLITNSILLGFSGGYLLIRYVSKTGGDNSK